MKLRHTLMMMEGHLDRVLGVKFSTDGKKLVVVEKGEAAPGGSAKEKPAETSGENVNMTAAPESSNPVALQAAAPVVAANQTSTVNATETPAQ